MLLIERSGLPAGMTIFMLELGSGWSMRQEINVLQERLTPCSKVAAADGLYHLSVVLPDFVQVIDASGIHV